MAFKIKSSCVGCGVCKLICPVGAIIGLPRKIQVIDPWLCIDCGACGKVCPHQSVIDSKGQIVARVRLKKRWPKPIFNLDVCVACRICIEACPTSFLTLSADAGTRTTIRKPVFAPVRTCISCGICVAVCPVDAVKMAPLI